MKRRIQILVVIVLICLLYGDSDKRGISSSAITVSQNDISRRGLQPKSLLRFTMKHESINIVLLEELRFADIRNISWIKHNSI